MKSIILLIALGWQATVGMENAAVIPPCMQNFLRELHLNYIGKVEGEKKPTVKEVGV